MSAIQIQNHMTNGQSSLPNLPQGGSKRPKLSLQTASLSSTYASSARSQGPSTAQSAFTPTTANTLSNTWDLTIRPSPISRAESPRPKAQLPAQPYSLALPFGIKSILKNSPLPSRQGSVSASPHESRRKVFFPQPKKVLFRTNLEETIQTKQYVARHYDLSSSEDEADEKTPSVSSSPESTPGLHSPPPSRKRKALDRRDSGICVDTPLKAAPQDAESTSKPKPRSCKRRRWQWTLGSDEPAVQEVVSPTSTITSTPLSAGERHEDESDNEVEEDESTRAYSTAKESTKHNVQGQDLGMSSSIEGASSSVSDTEHPDPPADT